MKAEFDKEIDSLLRERARRGRAMPLSPDALSGGASHSAHLDADEQSAYAENALPAAARAHYAAHLADCDDCRHSVTRLALAAGMPAQLASRETAAGETTPGRVNWRERLGVLFAPRAWRYVVPALALLLVSVVSLILLTRGTDNEMSLARRKESAATDSRQAAPQPIPVQPETHHAPQNGNTAGAAGATPDGHRGGIAAPETNADSSREQVAANSPPVEVAQPLASVSDDAPPPPMPSGGGAGARAMPELMATPAPVAESATVMAEQAAKTGSGERIPEFARDGAKPGHPEDRYDTRREQTSGPRRNNEQARNTRAAEANDSRSRVDSEAGTPAAATAAPAPSTAATTAAKRTRRQEADRSQVQNRPGETSDGLEIGRAGSAGETRTVAGRKFRRQGNAWIDTAYNAGQSYTVVRRNSEQFRALVADEPELRRISGAFGGEVTVVWKGRAYRIR